MMDGRLYIDGKDAYTNFGVWVTAQGWNELISYPPLKSVDKNDWQEQDGEEPDLSYILLDARSIKIPFAFQSIDKMIAFINYLMSAIYHKFTIDIGREYTLRYQTCTNLDAAEKLGFITLQFSDDFGRADFPGVNQSSNIPTSTDYRFDGTNLSDFGARVLEGSLSEIIKIGQVKENAMTTSKYGASEYNNNGKNYDSKNVDFTDAPYDQDLNDELIKSRPHFKSKDVQLKILMRADDLNQLWINYDCLLFRMLEKKEHTLYVERLNKSFPFYYKSQNVTTFYPTDKIWLEFTLTLTLYKDFRL